MIIWYSSDWSVVPVMLLLLAALILFVSGRNGRVQVIVLTMLGLLASLLALTLQLHQNGPLRYTIGGWGAPLGIDLYVDGLSLLMLWLTAVVGICVSIYSLFYFRSDATAQSFWPLWLLLWCGLNALFLSADIFNLYVTLEMITLSAVPLIVLAGNGAALAGGLRYLLYALLGSLVYLLGVALLYAEYSQLDIALLGMTLQPSLLTLLAVTFLLTGLMIKTALFPLHFWLPAAHASAPAPVSALLSALVVKASFYLILRFGMDMLPGIMSVGIEQMAGVLGAAAIIYGSIQALRQTRLKLLIAYSTVAQLGYLLMVFPLSGELSLAGTTLLALSHGLAKAAMFLVAGNVMLCLGHDRIAAIGQGSRQLTLTIFAFGIAGVAIIGLPPSAGFLGKWLLLQAAIDGGQWWWFIVIIIGSLLAAAYVFRVLGSAFIQSERSFKTPAAVTPALALAPLALALLSLLLGAAGMPVLSLLAIDAATPLSATNISAEAIL